MGDDGLDALVSGVGGGARTGQHGAGVEDVEPLVLHGAHIEVVHRHDHEDVQIVFAAVDLLVPAHGLLQAVHGVLQLADVFRFDVDAQGHVATAAGAIAVFHGPEVTGHQGEQIGRLGERIFPGGPVTSALGIATGHGIAVGEQDRVLAPVGLHRGGEDAHHVRPVQVVGDLAEALGLALGAEHGAGDVQSFEGGIAFRMDAYRGLEHEGLALRLQGQAARLDLVVARRQGLVVQRHRQQFQFLPVQHQRRQARATRRVALQAQLGMHQGLVVMQLEAEAGFLDEVLGRLVVLQVDGLGLVGAHGLRPYISAAEADTAS
ncbi:hypothetical protein QE444_002245 [Pseudomonas sp. SORGH_AS199]|nr:hypothetical protein [Pseudomonas sp. SORGH_AS_0199]